MSLCVALYVPGILGVLYFLIWQVNKNKDQESFQISEFSFFLLQGLHLTNRVDFMRDSIDDARPTTYFFVDLFN